MKRNILGTVCLTLLVLLNVFDAYLTIKYVKLNVVVEKNPLMAEALNAGTGWFVAVKALLILFGGFVLHRYRYKFLAITGLVATTGVYAALIGWWFYGLYFT